MSQSTSQQAVERAGQVAGTAGDRAQEVAGVATSEARRVGSQAADQGRELLGNAKQHAWQQAEAQTDQLASTVSRWSQQAHAVLDGRPEEAPELVGRAREALNGLDRFGDRLQQGGLEGAARDLKRFARRRPGVFLAGAGVLGFAAGRLLRAEKDVHSADGSGDGKLGARDERMLVDGDGIATDSAIGRSTVTPPPLAAGDPTVVDGPAGSWPPSSPEPSWPTSAPTVPPPPPGDPAVGWETDPTVEHPDLLSEGPASSRPDLSVLPPEYRNR